MSIRTIIGGFAGRSAFRDRIGNCENVEQVVNVIRDLLGSIAFKGDVRDGTGRTKVHLAADASRDPIINSCRVPLEPYGLKINNNQQPYTGPAAHPKPTVVVAGTVNQTLPQPTPDMRAPIPGAEASVPKVSMAIRGYNNYSLASTDGYLSGGHPSPAVDEPHVRYSSVQPTQELHISVEHGGKILYGRIHLSENPDDAVPQPLLGWQGRAFGPAYPTNPNFVAVEPAVADKIVALQQMHNDLVQSLLAHGVLRLVPRVSSASVNLDPTESNCHIPFEYVINPG